MFDPLPAPVRALEDIWEDLGKKIERARSETVFQDELKPSAEERRQRLKEAWKELLPTLKNLVSQLSWQTDIPDSIAEEDSLDSFAHELLGESRQGKPLRDDFRQFIQNELDKAIREAERTAGETSEELKKIEEQLKQNEQKQNELKKQYPNLDRELALFSAADDQPDALAIFQALEHHAKRWANVEWQDEKLTRVREEFAKVSPADAGKCARMLEDFLQPRQQARKELNRLEEEQKRLEKDRESAFSSEKLRPLREIERQIYRPLNKLLDEWESCHKAREHETLKAARAEARKQLEELKQTISTCQKKINELIDPKKNKEFMEYLQKLVEAIMNRYSMVEGCLPLRLELPKDDNEHGYHVLLGDGRKLEHLSSGQKAQAALAMLVGQNQGAASLLAHRIILLDDITTDYDLSNLSRQAILLRQLAYGMIKPEDRRQVFLSSHHEDMTNQILDLLAPPEGGRMRFIRFTDWSNVTGPQYEQLEVEPSSRIDEDELKRVLGGF